MTNGDEQNQRKVGYRSPPRSGQFQKGVSGNPKGRPRKRGDEPSLPDHRDPTVQEVIRAEINREIFVTDHAGRHSMTAKQAVMRAMNMTALKGGVLAQRSVLEMAEREEKRYHKRKQQTFRFWSDYKETAAARIAAGAPQPDDDPHPDDIKLDWRTQEVRIEGPIDKQDRAAAEVVCVVRDLAYLMAFYRDEFSSVCDENGRITHIGAYLGLYLECNHLLWPRMRKPPEAYDEAIKAGAALGWATWGKELAAYCAALGLPFLPRKKEAVPVAIPLKSLHIGKPIIVPPMPHRPRRQHRDIHPR